MENLLTFSPIKTSDLLDTIESILFFNNAEGKEFRCPNCNQLQFKGYFLGNIEIKCFRCKGMMKFENNK